MHKARPAATARSARRPEAQGGAASQQISAARVRQDLVAQRVSVVASYRATPSTGSNSVLYVWFGRWSGNTCHAKAVVAASAVGASTDGVGYFLDDSGATSSSFGVSRSLQGQELTIQSSAHAGIRAADWDCAFAKVRNLQGTEDYQGFFAVDLTTTYVPQLAISTISPIQGSYRGRWTTVKLDAANRGRVDARGTTVTASGAGLKFNRKKISLGTVGDRRTKYGITFKVKPPARRPARPPSRSGQPARLPPGQGHDRPQAPTDSVAIAVRTLLLGQ
ncbi:hypothetical protein [Aeromicrobium sp. UC242_57]|uniref:hypothetical protein n=1 Tax=Aeromicrobium sp. UC242_57 TaxID=3374624 RepID=UPI003790E5C6